MPRREYIRHLTDIDRIRHCHFSKEGKIKKFSIQYEAYIKGRWRPIVRYDTAHGFAHKDLIYPDGSKRIISFPNAEYSTILTEGEADLIENWRKYRERFERRTR